jgi:hypothetical protein
MVEGLEIRIALPRVAAFVIGRVLQPVLEKAQGVAVPGGDFHLRAKGEMIELQRAAHVIVRNRRIGPGTDRGNLPLVEPRNLIGGKAPEIQRMGRVGFRHGQVGQVDLIEVVILH